MASIVQWTAILVDKVTAGLRGIQSEFLKTGTAATAAGATMDTAIGGGLRGGRMKKTADEYLQMYKDIQRQVAAIQIVPAKDRTPEQKQEISRLTDARYRAGVGTGLGKDELIGVREEILATTRAAANLPMIGEKLSADSMKLIPVQQRIAALKTQLQQYAKLPPAQLTTGMVQDAAKSQQELFMLQQGMDAIKGRSMTLTSAFYGMRMGLLTVAFAFAAVRMAIGALSFIKEGAQLESIRTIYENLAKSVNISSDLLLAGLQKASRGTMDNATLMRAGNRAMLVGGKEFADQLPQLFEIARGASLATGQDINYVFESITKGIAKGSPLLLDNAEIYIKVGASVDAYAKSLGKTTLQLTSQERSMALLNAVVQQGSQFLRRMGVDGDQAVDTLNRFPAAWKNFRTAMGQQIGVPGFLNTLSTWLEKSAEKTTALDELSKSLDSVLWSMGVANVGKGGLVPFFEIETPIEAEYLAQLIEIKGVLDSIAGMTPIVGIGGSVQYAEQAKQLSELSKRFEEIRTKVELMHMTPQGAFEFFKRQTVTEAINLLQEFTTAFNEAQSKTATPEALSKGMGELSSSLKNLAIGIPNLPKLADSLYELDSSKIYEFVSEIRRLKPNPEVSAAADQLYDFANLATDAQNQLIANLRGFQGAMTQFDLRDLASQIFQTNTPIEDLISNFSKLPSQIQDTWREAGLFGAAIDYLRSKMDRPATLEVRTQGFETGMKDIDALSEKLDRALGPAIGQAFRDSMMSTFTEAFKALSGATEAEITELSDDLRRKMTDAANIMMEPFDALQGRRESLKSIRDALESAMSIEMPKISGGLLSIDTAGIDRYLDKLLELDAGSKMYVDATRGMVDATRAAQQIELSRIMAMSSVGAALNELATSTLGYGASVGDLISKFDSLGQPIQNAISKLMSFDEAVSRARANAAQPITINVLTDQINAAIQAADQFGIRLAQTGAVSIEQARSARGHLESDLLGSLQRTQGMTKWDQDVQLAIVQKGYDDQLSAVEKSLAARENATDDSWDKSAASVKSKIEEVLNAGIPVTDTQILDAAAGQYKDVAMESARQLDDIAQHGREALSRHKDWISKFQIPPDLLLPDQESEKRLKAWAAGFRDDVKNFTRPDLINWDTFVDEFKNQMTKDAAQKITIDMGVTALKKAGLLEGKSDEEARKMILKTLGIAEPEFTIETLFATKDNTSTLVKKITGTGKDYLEVQYELVPRGTEPIITPATGLPPGTAPSTKPPVGEKAPTTGPTTSELEALFATRKAAIEAGFNDSTALINLRIAEEFEKIKTGGIVKAVPPPSFTGSTADMPQYKTPWSSILSPSTAELQEIAARLGWDFSSQLGQSLPPAVAKAGIAAGVLSNLAADFAAQEAGGFGMKSIGEREGTLFGTSFMTSAVKTVGGFLPDLGDALLPGIMSKLDQRYQLKSNRTEPLP